MQVRTIKNLHRETMHRDPLVTRYRFHGTIILFEANREIQDIHSDLDTIEVCWAFVRRNDSIIGAVHIDSLHAALQYSSTAIPVGALIEHIPARILVSDLAVYMDGAADAPSFKDPVYLVENEDGHLVGHYRMAEFSERHSHHTLIKADQELLLSDPVINQVATSAATLHLEVYIIGGWARDFLVNTPCHDLDFAVAGDALALATHLANNHGGVVHRFSSFGGAHWVISDTLTIDFTETRKETYRTLGALPVVERTDIHQDLKRRDFTINAIAIALHKPQLGLILDPFDGLTDLRQGCIRSLHGLSFLQDPTRIFRASRYSARFNMPISISTQLQIEQATTQICPGEMLTRTRIGIELSKIFKEEQPHRCWKLLIQWNVWTHWLPAWSTVSLHNQTTLEYAFTQTEWSECWWMQLRCALSDPAAKEWSSTISIRPNGLKLWNQFPTQVSAMVKQLSQISDTTPQWRSKVGNALQKSTPVHWLFLEAANSTFTPFIQWWIDDGQHCTRKTTGRDILAMDVPKGPQIATMLQIAQNTAWEGGNKDAEQAAILFKISKKSADTK